MALVSWQNFLYKKEWFWRSGSKETLSMLYFCRIFFFGGFYIGGPPQRERMHVAQCIHWSDPSSFSNWNWFPLKDLYIPKGNMPPTRIWQHPFRASFWALKLEARAVKQRRVAGQVVYFLIASSSTVLTTRLISRFTKWSSTVKNLW